MFRIYALSDDRSPPPPPLNISTTGTQRGYNIPSFRGSNFSTPRFLVDVLLVDAAVLLELAFRLAAARALRAEGGGFAGPFAGFSSLESTMALD